MAVCALDPDRVAAFYVAVVVDEREDTAVKPSFAVADLAAARRAAAEQARSSPNMIMFGELQGH